METVEPSIQNQLIELPELKSSGHQLFIKREDQIHPYISGNKFRKLKYNLEAARKKGARTLISFGGAYSNHIHALAYAGKKYNFQTVGVIRGDELGVDLKNTLATNDTLRFAMECGMSFEFVDRQNYRDNKQDIFNTLSLKYQDSYMVPEGGTNGLAIKGCKEILEETDKTFDYIAVAVGTGGTISGIVNSAENHQMVIGFPSLKGSFLEEVVRTNTIADRKWSLINDYHFGGYAKINEKLISFINHFYQQTQIPLDPIYTGKMMYGIIDLMQRDFFKPNSRVLAIHTGGLQGIDGMNRMLKKKQMPMISI